MFGGVRTLAVTSEGVVRTGRVEPGQQLPELAESDADRATRPFVPVA